MRFDSSARSGGALAGGTEAAPTASAGDDVCGGGSGVNLGGDGARFGAARRSCTAAGGGGGSRFFAFPLSPSRLSASGAGGADTGSRSGRLAPTGKRKGTGEN